MRLKALSKQVAIAIIIAIIIVGVAAGYFAFQAGKSPASPTSVSSSLPSSPSATTSRSSTTSSSSTGSASPTEARLASEIVIGVTDKVTDLDPANAYDFFTWEILYNVMEGLVKYKPGTAEIVPGLAENWTVSSDGKVWTFVLRPNLKFSDGTPLTAKDVVRSIERVMRIKGDPSWLVTSFVEKVVAKDDRTVVFYLKQPTSFFLALVATPPYFPVNPKYPEDKIASDATWGGAGPYRIVKFVRDVELVLEANPYYYGPKPKTDKIIVKFYRDASALRLALESGEIDIAWRTLRPTDIQYFKQQSGFKVIEVPGSFIRYICFNTKVSPTNNLLVRKALAAAIDRQQIIDTVLLGAGEPLYSLVPKGLWSNIDAFKIYGDANIELAKKLLEQAGYSKDKPLEITLWYTPTHYGDTEADIAQLIAQQWEKTGLVKVTIKSAEWSTYVSYIRKGQLQAYLLGWYPDYLDPDDYLTPFLDSNANGWSGTGFANETVNKLLEKAQTIVDQQERAKIYEEVQKILAEQVPYVPLFQGKLFIVTRSDIEGIIPSPTMILMYNTIYKVQG